MKIKNTVLLVLIIFLLVSITPNVYATSIWYYDNGNFSHMFTDKGNIWFYENGNIDHIFSGSVSVYVNEDGSLSHIFANNGNIYYSNGKVSSLNGDIDSIISELQNALQNLNEEAVTYMKKINIQVPGAKGLEDGATVFTQALNKIIQEVNSSTNSISTVSASSSSTSTPSSSSSVISVNTNNGTSTSVNVPGVSVTTGTNNSSDENGDDYDDLETGLSILGSILDSVSDSNGASVNIGGADGIHVGSDGVSVGGNKGVNVNSDGVSVGTTGSGSGTTGVTVNVNGQDVQASNNTHLYIIMGVGFVILLLGMVFGFIIIKKKQGNIVTKE